MGVHFRRNRWVADWRDATGRRRVLSFARKEDAERAWIEGRRKAYGPKRSPALDPGCTVGEYVQHWLKLCGARLQPATLRSYAATAKNHILPTLGAIPFRDVRRSDLKALLVGKLDAGLARGTVAHLQLVLSSLFVSGIEDEVLAVNPAARIGRSLGLGARHEDGVVRAFTMEQLAGFLDAARTVAPDSLTAYLLMAHTGCRIGEALGVEWADYDAGGRSLRIHQQLTEPGVLARLKTKASRREVDVSWTLAEHLARERTARAERALAAGVEMASSIALERGIGRYRHAHVRVQMRRVLVKAGLPAHFTPHSLRHTWATSLLGQGVSINYVSRALGHTSLELTLRLYGSWHRQRDVGAVDHLAGLVESHTAGLGRQAVLEFPKKS